MSIQYDSLRAWVDEFERRLGDGHEMAWADEPRPSRKGRGLSRQHSRLGFWDLTDDTHHAIPVPLVIEGFKDLPVMEDVLRPKWLTWDMKTIERHSALKQRFLKEGLRAV